MDNWWPVQVNFVKALLFQRASLELYHVKLLINSHQGHHFFNSNSVIHSYFFENCKAWRIPSSIIEMSKNAHSLPLYVIVNGFATIIFLFKQFATVCDCQLWLKFECNVVWQAIGWMRWMHGGAGWKVRGLIYIGAMQCAVSIDFHSPPLSPLTHKNGIRPNIEMMIAKKNCLSDFDPYLWFFLSKNLFCFQFFILQLLLYKEYGEV